MIFVQSDKRKFEDVRIKRTEVTFEKKTFMCGAALTKLIGFIKRNYILGSIHDNYDESD